MLGVQPEYRAMIAVDVERSAGRGNVAQHTVREVLFAALREACAVSGIDWFACHRSDRGDGMVLVGPPDLPKTKFVYPFTNDLAERLRAHNRLAGPPVRIRVRMAMHAGDVYVEDGTVAGSPFEFLTRMLDAKPVKDGLAAAPESTTVALVVSPHIHDEVVLHGYVGIDRESFRRIRFTVKETTGIAWLQVPGHRAAEPASSAGTPAPAASAAAEPRYLQKNAPLSGGTVFAVQGGTQIVHPEESR